MGLTTIRTTNWRHMPRGPVSVFFSLEKEIKEPWNPPTLLSLGDDMIDPDPEGGVGGERGE